ncbi:hypothetical protein GOV04_04780 [Candidatus Woesearchaeota archaeon]|nr:hypothetical protein [Candidatus Woesearchaeota archaeon]
MKKAQVIVQYLVYVIALVVLVLLLLFGYQMLSGLEEDKTQIQLMQAYNSLKHDVTELSTDYGTTKHVTYYPPKIARKACIIDVENRELVASNEYSMKNYPQMREQTLTHNLFFLGERDTVLESFELENIIVEEYPYYACYFIDGQWSLTLEGARRQTRVVLDDLYSYSVTGPVLSTTSIYTQDGLLELELQDGTSITNANAISIAVVEPTSPSAASENYNFQPDGATFSTPAILKVQFNPTITCAQVNANFMMGSTAHSMIKCDDEFKIVSYSISAIT